MSSYSDYEAIVQGYDDLINGIYPEVEIFGAHYLVSDLLKDNDPIAYQCGFLEYLDNEGIDLDKDEDLLKYYQNDHSMGNRYE